MLEFEVQAYRRGKTRVAGVDEAGRGPLAGPVVAAAVIFPKDLVESILEGGLSSGDAYLAEINDSKQVAPGRREKLFAALQNDPRVVKGIGVVSEKVIDQINIYQATIVAMKDALSKLNPAPEHVLVDGNRIGSFGYSQDAIVGGDARSLSIAAASILAKVYRDRVMLEYDAQFPQYNFRAHKGYATADHLERIRQHGPSPIHRLSFSPLRQNTF